MLLPWLIRSPRALAVAAIVFKFGSRDVHIVAPFHIGGAAAHCIRLDCQKLASFFLRMMQRDPSRRLRAELGGPDGLRNRGQCDPRPLSILQRFLALATATFLIVPYTHDYNITVEYLGCMAAL